MRPFLRAKIIKSYVYLSVILWYPTLQVSSGQFTVFDSIFYAIYSIPQSFTVYQTLAISLLAIFFGEILASLGVDSTLCWLGGQFYTDQDSML